MAPYPFVDLVSGTPWDSTMLGLEVQSVLHKKCTCQKFDNVYELCIPILLNENSMDKNSTPAHTLDTCNEHDVELSIFQFLTDTIAMQT